MTVDRSKLPKHIAIIMDGNGRWARTRNMPRVMGHRKGTDVVKDTVEWCIELGIPYLTLYAFSQENWKRPQQEVDFLMDLLDRFLTTDLKTLKESGSKLSTIGRVSELPEHIQEKIKKAKEETSANTKLNLTIALNYGSRQEMVDAINRILNKSQQHSSGSTKITVDEKAITENLDTAGLPDPDLLIRTSGEMRLSNFLLWQCSYSEIYISKKLWPEFDKSELENALEEFGKRQRRFGAVA